MIINNIIYKNLRYSHSDQLFDWYTIFNISYYVILLNKTLGITNENQIIFYPFYIKSKSMDEAETFVIKNLNMQIIIFQSNSIDRIMDRLYDLYVKQIIKIKGENCVYLPYYISSN